MILLLRLLLVICFCLFWGGLTFYTGWVVRIIHDVVDDPMHGGLTTQRVTYWLQLLGAVTLVLMIANAVTVLRKSRGFGISLALTSLALLIALGGLFATHARLDAVIDVENAEVTDRAEFTMAHRRYNQFTTLEWIASLAYLPITLAAWQKIDRQSTYSKLDDSRDDE